ncbi:MAG: hypothetical protein ABJA34_08900 [Pseudonocardiales bacterium]
MSARLRLVLAVGLALVVAAGLVLVGQHMATWSRPAVLQPSDECVVNALGLTVTLQPEQATNAATIAAAGLRRGLPPHAVTIALATALQESKLHNLAYGDRDSIGLFQQRPSQGWGTEAQILDPRYAASAFYARLTAVPGWQTMPVAAAAQRVQRSADGTAYAIWEGQARTLSQGLTGRAGAAVGCRIRQPGGDPATLLGELRTDFGLHAVDRPLADPTRGWAIAGWLVTHSPEHRLLQVSYLGHTWKAKTGRWLPAGPDDGRVRYVTGPAPQSSRSPR